MPLESPKDIVKSVGRKVVVGVFVGADPELVGLGIGLEELIAEMILGPCHIRTITIKTTATPIPQDFFDILFTKLSFA